MSRWTARLAPLSAVALVLAACSPDQATSPASGALLSASPTGAAMKYLHARVCPGAVVGTASCHALVRVDAGGSPLASATYTSGYNPTDLQAAYGLAAAAASNGATQTIAIVDAYNDPNAENDINVYRRQFGIPECTTANGCFRKVSQTGTTTYPKSDASWSQEISLDLDMASAICPKCKILLVEATTPSFANLAAAVDQAAKLGATVISNSYGGPEYSSEVADESHFNHPGIAITVSSGDNGYGVEFPAASRYVIAVGGTNLKKSTSSRGWTETAWTGAGSGCSAYIAKPSWQTDAGCARRTVSDVSAIADPNTGVAVYDSYAYRGSSGWMVFGGTSVSAPIIASVYALAGNATSQNYAQGVYTSRASLNDVLSGSNGSCGGSYLCTATTGYDGPTGNGTPNGLTAF
jgi:subtilase family serine protease